MKASMIAHTAFLLCTAYMYSREVKCFFCLSKLGNGFCAALVQVASFKNVFIWSSEMSHHIGNIDLHNVKNIAVKKSSAVSQDTSNV